MELWNYETGKLVKPVAFMDLTVSSVAFGPTVGLKVDDARRPKKAP